MKLSVRDSPTKGGRRLASFAEKMRLSLSHHPQDAVITQWPFSMIAHDGHFVVFRGYFLAWSSFFKQRHIRGLPAAKITP